MEEVLNVLEKKIASLVGLIKNLKTENARLVEEHAHLQAQNKSLQQALQEDSRRVNQEKEVTRQVVDDLIKCIDSLVEYEQHQ